VEDFEAFARLVTALRPWLGQLVVVGGWAHRLHRQDILYIHDTLELFGGSLGELRRLWVEEVRPRMTAKTARRAETIAQELFAEVTDTSREAARIPQDRRLAPENVQRACEYGLGEILGTA